MTHRKSPTRISLISLGCPKNLVDSETFLGTAAVGAFHICASEADADAVIINTCAFIRDAEQESLDVISEIAALKKKGRLKKIVVGGCLGEKMGPALQEKIPSVDFVVGVLNEKNIARTIAYLAKEFYGGAPGPGRRARVETPAEYPRLPLTPRHYAYLRVAEGCDNRCSYCLIPTFRGRFRSKPLGDLIEEAKFFEGIGCRELNLIAQDTTNYGADIYGRRRLGELLRRISDGCSIQWLRILYTHPGHYDEDLIREVSRNPRIVKYLDLPLQHINDKILTSMGRKVSRDSITKLIEKLRREIPGLYLRTTFIVGLPGETESDFSELADFVREMRFERMGVFTYSRERGTKAFDFENQLPEEIKEERRHRLMSIQQRIAFEISRSVVGKEVEVLVEEGRSGGYIGRFYGDAPLIDNVVFLKGRGLKVGELYRALVTGARGYDLEARLKDKKEKRKEVKG